MNNEKAYVVKGAVTPDIVVAKMGEQWNQGVVERIGNTIKLVEPNVYEAEWGEGTKYICTITPLAGDYSMLTTFLQHE